MNDGSGVKQVDSEPNQLETLASGKVVAKKNGYVYVYTSNESKQDVLFDNLGVLDVTGPVLEETHYYPFGLTMAGISTVAPLKIEGKRKFNGIEFNHKEFSDGSGLELYAAKFRGLDPQIGRWWQIDPKPDMELSPYSMMKNNPIRFNDFLGDTTFRFSGQGTYLGMHDVDQPGIRGATGSYHTYKNAKGKKYQTWMTDNLFAFNDPIIDVKQLNEMKIGEKGLGIISDENINWIMNRSHIKHMWSGKRWFYALTESNGGYMDFNGKYTLPSKGIVLNDDNVKQYDTQGGFMIFKNGYTAYNLNDAGQFLWGQAMSRLGFSYSNSQLGSESFARAHELQWDSKADQAAISNGFFYYINTKNSTPGIFEGLPLENLDR